MILKSNQFYLFNVHLSVKSLFLSVRTDNFDIFGLIHDFYPKYRIQGSHKLKKLTVLK